MRTVLTLLRIAALAACVFAFVATWGALSSTGMPHPEDLSGDSLWWYSHQDDVRQVGLVVLGAGLVTMLVPAMLVTLGGAFVVAAYAWIVGEGSSWLEQPGAWWIFAVALVAVALVRQVVRPRRTGAAQTPPA